MALNFPSSCRVGSWCDKETLRLHPGIHQLSERIFLFVSSRFSCFLTDHFCLFMTPNWLCVRRDDCQRLRSTPLPVWSDSNSLPADDWCVLIFLLTEWCRGQIDADTYDQPRKTTCDRRVEEQEHSDELHRWRYVVFRRNQLSLISGEI